jgi:small-conductance mechanosensitive channel
MKALLRIFKSILEDSFFMVGFLFPAFPALIPNDFVLYNMWIFKTVQILFFVYLFLIPIFLLVLMISFSLSKTSEKAKRDHHQVMSKLVMETPSPALKIFLRVQTLIFYFAIIAFMIKLGMTGWAVWAILSTGITFIFTTVIKQKRDEFAKELLEE